jgi:SOS response regulatory protein OraA/RecX
VAGGALDDARFAECFATDKRDLAGWGEERIAAALIERGVERGLAERAAAEGFSDQVGRAAQLLTQRGEPLADDGARSRALGFLTRRGFTYEVAYDAIRGQSRGRR